MLPDTLDRRAVRWVLRQFEYVQTRQREQANLQIAFVEIGVARAIARAFGGKVPPLEIAPRPEHAQAWTPPAWMRRFEEANKHN